MRFDADKIRVLLARNDLSEAGRLFLFDLLEALEREAYLESNGAGEVIPAGSQGGGK